ncbi:MAG: DUF4340 domain-containing protein, partial [Planctomycetes bacterium]|nr:DUF4340 domain-containing protein [Planctomycetota bacterium]
MNKPIAVTLVVLVLLVLVYFFGGSPDSENVPEETAGLKAFQEMNLDEVAKIVIAKGKAEPVELVKRDGTWYVASRWDFEADPERIEKILGGLRKIESPALVGERDASHPDFEVNDIKGGFLTLFDREGKKLSRLVIGKTAPSANFRVADVFVRFGDDKETFRVRSDIRGDANLYSSDVEAKRYLKTKLFELDEGSEIVSVRIQRPGEDDLLVERRSRVK